MLRNIVILAATFGGAPFTAAQGSASPDGTASQERPGLQGHHITFKVQWISIDESDIPASIRLPRLGSCGVIDPRQAALLGAAQSSRRVILVPDQTLTMRNGERGEVKFGASGGLTFIPVLSDDNRVIRLALTDSSGMAGTDCFPPMNPEVPVGKCLLIHIKKLSESRKPTLWERGLGRKAKPYYSHILLVVTPEIGGER